MIHLPHWFPAHLIGPMAWGLIHSLWQILLIALAFRAVSLVTRGRSVELRYAVGSLALALCLVVPTITTMILTTPPSLATPTIADGAPSAAERATGLVETGGPGPLVALAAAVDRSPGAVVGLWAMGTVCGLLLLFRDWLRTRRLAASATAPEPARLRAMLDGLASEVGIRRRIGLVMTGEVDSPAVLGWRRPVVLLPPSMEEQDDASIEPLLVHELAHVRRHDFPAHLAQSITVRLLFFHPAVHWLSRRVRQEREACCDRLAAAACRGGALAYARALTALESARAHLPALGVGEGDLSRRIRRLVEPQGGRGRRPLAGVALLAACLAASGVTGEALRRSRHSTVIAGLDPVLLLEGARVRGSARWSVEHGGYRYLFTDAANRARFVRDPQRYAVRNVAACPVSGRRVLETAFRVVDGSIVLFCCPDLGPGEIRRAAASLSNSTSPSV